MRNARNKESENRREDPKRDSRRSKLGSKGGVEQSEDLLRMVKKRGKGDITIS